MVGLSLNPPPNQAIQDLVQLVGDEATKEIVRIFLQSFPESIREMAGAARPDQLRIAHGLKSSALHMGAEKLAAQMEELEARLSMSGSAFDADDRSVATGEFEAFAADLRRYVQG